MRGPAASSFLLMLSSRESCGAGLRTDLAARNLSESTECLCRGLSRGEHAP